MTRFLDKLNLRPQERRLVVLVVIAVFVVLNIWWVWPRFGDWKTVQKDLTEAHQTLANFQKQIAKVSGPDGLEARLKELQGQGANVAMDEQQIQLMRTVQDQARLAGLRVSNWGTIRPAATASEFFEEQTLAIQFSSSEPELVKFLVNLGAADSMIRVREMSLHPDRNRHRLDGRLTLTASYQKRSTGATPAPGRRTTQAAAGPRN
jgi:Tfp pilus assembly protein PilO